MQCATVQSIVVNLAGDPTVRTSFDAYYNAVASRLELSMSLTHKGISSENRNMNKLEGERKTKNQRDSGRATKKQKHDNKSSQENPFVPELKVYEKSVWKGLSKANQNAVRALYASSGKNGRSGQNSQNNTPHPGASRDQRYSQPNYGQNYGNNYPQNNRAASQFEMQNYGNFAHNPYRGINMALPPYPGSMIVPPPPPYPQNNSSSASLGTITVPAGDIGQAFGNFQPGP